MQKQSDKSTLTTGPKMQTDRSSQRQRRSDPQHQGDVNIASGWLDWQMQIVDTNKVYIKTNQDGTSFQAGDQSLMVNVDLSLASHEKITVDGFGEIRVREEFSESI